MFSIFTCFIQLNSIYLLKWMHWSDTTKYVKLAKWASLTWQHIRKLMWNKYFDQRTNYSYCRFRNSKQNKWFSANTKFSIRQRTPLIVNWKYWLWNDAQPYVELRIFTCIKSRMVRITSALSTVKQFCMLNCCLLAMVLMQTEIYNVNATCWIHVSVALVMHIFG